MTLTDNTIKFSPSAIFVEPVGNADGEALARSAFSQIWPEITEEILEILCSQAVSMRFSGLTNAERMLVDFDDHTKRTLFGKIRTLDAVMAGALNDNADPSLRTYVSVAKMHSASSEAAVFWVRETAKGKIAYLLSDLRVDTSTGAVELQLNEPENAHGIQIMAKISGLDVANGAIELASSVSWALPPPWGAAATGGLTLLRMLLGAKRPEEHPDPFAKLLEDFESFMKFQKVQQYAEDFKNFADELRDEIEGLHPDPEHINSAGSDYLRRLFLLLEGKFQTIYEHTDELIRYCETLLDNPHKKYNLDDYLVRINTAIAGISLWITYRKVYMQLLAAQAGAAEKNNDEKTFIDKTASWHSEFRVIKNTIFGTVQPKSQGFFDRLETVTKRVHAERLKVIGSVEKWSKVSSRRYEYGSPIYEYVYGAKFVDRGLAEGKQETSVKNGSRHIGCNNDVVVSAVPKVEALRKEHVSKIEKELQEHLSSVPAVIANWSNSVHEFIESMPSPRPENAPVVTPLESGPATPKGRWVAERFVQYAMQIKSESGPSELGPWSKPLEIGATAYAHVVFPPLPGDTPGNATKLLKRRIYEATPDDAAIKNVALAKAETATIDDKKD